MKHVSSGASVTAGFFLAGTVVVTLFPQNARASCGASFCPVNTQWEVQGAWQRPGLRVDLRYEYLDQDQPRLGRRRVAVGETPQHHDEVRTLNRNTLLSFDYTVNERWGVSLTAPYVDREHEHIHHHHGELLNESWHITTPGDMRLLGRYQMSEKPVSLILGLKLPTGSTDETNADGDTAERSLQPGSGTTDVMLGVAFSHGSLRSPWSWFVQAQGQHAVDEHDEFQPGDQFNLDGGIRYVAGGGLSLMLQGNLVIKSRDSGAEAEPESSGGTFLFLAPGLSYALSPRWQVYAFLQQPVFQDVNGIQLTADRGYIAGISAQF